MEIYALDLKFEAGILQGPQASKLIGKLPNNAATNFRYSAASEFLVFSDYVYPDGDLMAVREDDEAWDSRGNTAYVYDSTYVRHWDTWVGPKRLSLFSVHLSLGTDQRWNLGGQFANLLKGTNHVCQSLYHIL